MRKIMLRPMICVAALLLSTNVCAAQRSTDYQDNVGGWTISGLIRNGGHVVGCRMQRPSTEQRDFAYLATIAADSDGLGVKAIFTVSTQLPDGSKPSMSLKYDSGRPEQFSGTVSGGYLSIDLSAMDVLRMAQELDKLQNSKHLVVTALLKGAPSETNTIDLTDSNEAFDRNGMCMKAMVDKGIEQMKEAQQSSPAEHGTDDAITDVAQKEIDRIKAIDPENLVLRPVTVACVTATELRDWLVASMAKSESADIDGCYPIQKAVKVRILDFPNVLTAHIKFMLPAGASSLIQGIEFFTLPAQVVDRKTVSQALLLDVHPSTRKPAR
jgi:hypothetical protein